MTDDDPLDGADIGDTATVREESEIWVGDGLTNQFSVGTDRFADTEVVDMSVRIDEYGEQYIKVTTESKVTKTLPRKWDQCKEPRTASERRQRRLATWGSRIAQLLPIPVTLGIGLAVTHRVMSRLDGEVMFGGDPLTYSAIDLIPVVMIVLISVAVVFAVPRLPRPAPRGGSR